MTGDLFFFFLLLIYFNFPSNYCYYFLLLIHPKVIKPELRGENRSFQNTSVLVKLAHVNRESR